MPKVLSIHLSIKTTLGKNLLKKLSFFYHLWKLNKLFRPVAEAFSAVVEIAFYVRRGTYRRKIQCFEGIRVSYNFRTTTENIPAFLQDIFVGIVENTFHLSVRKIEDNKLETIYMIYHFFPETEKKKFGLSSIVLSRDLQNSNLPVQGEEIFFSV